MLEVMDNAGNGSQLGAEEQAPTLGLTAYRIYNSGMRVEAARESRDWMDQTDRRFAKRCLPMLIANQSAWVLLSHCDFNACWNGDNSREAIVIQSDETLPHDGPQSHFGYGIITFTIPFLFRTSPGYNLLVRGPANSPKDGIAPLEGIVECDWAPSTFTMNWKFTRSNTIVHFKKGEPICALVPQRRGELESFEPNIAHIDSDPGLAAEYHAWAQSRRDFNEHLASEQPANAPWQKDYFQGRSLAGHLSEHQTKLRIREFAEPEG